MTGQVKEDILSRFGELGIVVSNGVLSFKPSLLRKQEFLAKDKTFNYIDVDQKKQTIAVSTGSLAFTYCQVPVIYTKSHQESVQIAFKDGTEKTFEQLTLDATTSEALFQRTGEINHIIVKVIK
jgi:N-acetylglutamate synthase/N-acetylornithine aminotransferase